MAKNYSLAKEDRIKRLKEIMLVFLKLGITAFGGPAAHVAMMEEEIISKRKWISKEKFMDFYGATNLLPGPNSTELAIHLGYERGGILGLILGGVSFILPAMLSVIVLAVIYGRYGELPEISGISYGIKPVVIAIILQALIRLTKSGLKNTPIIVVTIIVVILSFLGFHEILLLASAGVIIMLIENKKKLKLKQLPMFAAYFPIFTAGMNTSGGKHISLASVFLNFLKIGSVLYGSGYVLLAFIEADFVERLGLITSDQLIDAVSVGQITPGPVFTTATFVGYLIKGIPGAILATIGIFLPAFILVGALNRIIPKLRQSTWFGGFLDGLNAASLALMAVVNWKLGVSSIIDIPTAILAGISLLLVFRFKINSAWLILGGGLIGYLSTVI
ncbi:MAG: chromate efflux transporter [Anaerolineaceae bacterium]|nr:MAG: chromate efflux transporter [Anaerolineaceae bacterium]